MKTFEIEKILVEDQIIFADTPPKPVQEMFSIRFESNDGSYPSLHKLEKILGTVFSPIITLHTNSRDLCHQILRMDVNIQYDLAVSIALRLFPTDQTGGMIVVEFGSGKLQFLISLVSQPTMNPHGACENIDPEEEKKCKGGLVFVELHASKI